jgi:hypothetical protein
MDTPIIVKIEAQRVERYEPMPRGGLRTVYHNTGTDRDGKRWTWLTSYEPVYPDDGTISQRHAGDYSYQQIGGGG